MTNVPFEQDPVNKGPIQCPASINMHF